MVDADLDNCYRFIERVQNKVLDCLNGRYRLPNLASIFMKRVIDLRKEREKHDSDLVKIEEEIFFYKVCVGVCEKPLKRGKLSPLVSTVIELEPVTAS